VANHAQNAASPKRDLHPKREKRRVMPFIAAFVAVALVAGGAGYVVLGRLHHKASYPKAWDPRVADIAAFVENERGLRFTHPVFVDFLTPAEYSKQARTDESKV